MKPLRFLTCAPGHFHAALVFKEMLPGIDPVVRVYAEPGPDLDAHLARLAAFSARGEDPTTWDVRVRTGADPLALMLAEKAGDVVVFSGRNRGKIDAMLAAVRAGLHVLADKPWVIDSEDLPKLTELLASARRAGVVVSDMMTERHEVATRLQRELVQDPDVFGEVTKGGPERPGAVLRSVHHLRKEVAGAPLRRPAWFFDVAQEGEGLADVGTHLVDLVPWVLFPGEAVDPADVKLFGAMRAPLELDLEQYTAVTGESAFPEQLIPSVRMAKLQFYGNTAAIYSLRGVTAMVETQWQYAATRGGDRHQAGFLGSLALVGIRQDEGEGGLPDLFVLPWPDADPAGVRLALTARVAALTKRYPGLALEDHGPEVRVVIPDALRTGHEAHFAQVTRQFLGWVADPASVPAWEGPNLFTKYAVTTRCVQLARASSH